MVKNSIYKSAIISIIGLIAIIFSAQWPVQFPGLAVPFTLQTAVLLLLGYLLDPKYALSVILTYIFLGLGGFSVFASAPNSLEMITSGSAGYLLGFIPAIWVVARYKTKGFKLIGLFILAHLIILILGLIGLMINKNLGLDVAFLKGVWPFVPGAVIKSLLVWGIIRLLDRYAIRY